MLKRVLILSLMVLLPLLAFSATTGKLIGTVVDKETGEALPGANVVVEGTNLGAAANVQGGFIILNIPPGIYSVKTSFIGYETVTISNIRVSVNLTTEIDFQLPVETIEVESIAITAERPLVNKNATNETHIMTSEDIQNMPVRSYAEVVSTAAGVVSARNSMYVRGGRADEIAYYVDGVYSNDLRTGARVGDVPINSLEQINYQAGGFNAEYGFANSGIVIASSKSGSSKLSITGEVVTDEFLSEESKNLGTYSYGYNAYNLSLSGPVFSDKIKFYAAAEKQYLADRLPSVGKHPVLGGEYTTEEVLYNSTQLDTFGIAPEEWILPVNMVGGPLPNNSLDRWSLNGNLLVDLDNIRLKFGGNGTIDNWQNYNQYRTLVNGRHTQRNEDYNYNVFGKITHTLGSNTFYEGTAYFSQFKTEAGDPVMWRNMMDYGDKTDVNGNGAFTPELVRNSGTGAGLPRLGSGVYGAIEPQGAYTLNNTNVIGLKFDLTHQLKNHEFRTGFEYRYNTIRRYTVSGWRLAALYENDPNTDPLLASRSAYTESFGYPAYFDNWEVDPTQTSDEGLDGAKHPIIGAFYLQDKIELADLVLNLGLRADYIDANDKKLVDPYDVGIVNGLLDPETLEDTEAHLSISPRLGISFPVTDKTVFHAQFGKFTQQPELRYLYTGWNYMAAQLNQGNAVQVGNPDLRPVSTTSYEIGVGQQIGVSSSVSLTAYYKEIRDLIVMRNRVNALPVTYAQFQNGDYSSVKGLSLTYNMRRTKGLSANLNYTLQYAAGTGSTSEGNFYITWIGNEYYPTFVAPLDYDQRHTFSLNLDYRVGPEANAIIRNSGINLLATAGSGFPYTPKRIGDTIFAARFSTAFPIAGTNTAYTDWTSSIDLRIDKSFKVAGQGLNVYLWVINVLGSENPFNRKNTRETASGFNVGIYEATGRPDENGWLSTSDGQKWIEDNNGARAEAMYRSFINSPLNWETPRQIRLGLRFDIN